MSSSSVNRVEIIGNLAAKPEIVSFEGGRVAKFSVATNERWKNKAGEPQKRADFHRVNVFNEALISAVIEKYLDKGSRIYISGSLVNRSWDDNGITRYATEIVLRPYNGELKMLDGPKQEPTKPAPKKTNAAHQKPAA
jgi:single-strand DNA-binding protein